MVQRELPCGMKAVCGLDNDGLLLHITITMAYFYRKGIEVFGMIPNVHACFVRK